MDQLEAVREDERLEALPRDAAEARQREVGLAAALPVVARELVQVVAQQLADDEEVLLPNEGRARG